MNGNQSLFFYGLGAKLVSSVGAFIALASIFVLMFSGILGIIGIIFGGAIFLWGKSMRFDFQRQSGTIIHRGDW